MPEEPCEPVVASSSDPFLPSTSVNASSSSSPSSSFSSPLWLSQLCFALLGVGYLFPFSALTQPVDFWHHLFGAELNLNFTLSATYNYTNLLFLAAIVLIWPRGNQVLRITAGFIGQMLVLIGIPTCYFIIYSAPGNDGKTAAVLYYWAVLAATGVLAIVTALLDCSVISFSSQFDSNLQEKLQLGVGLSTLIGSVYRIVTKAVFPSEPKYIVYSSVLYFYSGALTILICLFAFHYLVLRRSKERTVSIDHAVAPEEGETQSLLDPVVPIDLDKWKTFLKILWNELLIVLMFCITLAVWPALITEIGQFGPLDSVISAEWWPLFLLLLFSVSDVVGRFLVSSVRIPMLTYKTIWIPILLRAALVPVLLLQANYENIKGTSAANDWFSLFLVFFFGITNGYFGTFAIVAVNDCLNHLKRGSSATGVGMMQLAEEKKYAGTLTSFFLNFGLVLGASVGLVFERYLAKIKESNI